MKINIKTIGIEFTFDLHETGSKRVNFYRRLYGWKSSSNNGKYLYIKEGILSGIKHIRPTRSTIIVSVKDAKVLRKFFRENNVDSDEKIIILNKTNSRELGLDFDSDWDKVYSELRGNENLFFSVDF